MQPWPNSRQPKRPARKCCKANNPGRHGNPPTWSPINPIINGRAGKDSPPSGPAVCIQAFPDTPGAETAMNLSTFFCTPHGVFPLGSPLKTVSTLGKTVSTLENPVSTSVFPKVLTVSRTPPAAYSARATAPRAAARFLHNGITGNPAGEACSGNLRSSPHCPCAYSANP